VRVSFESPRLRESQHFENGWPTTVLKCDGYSLAVLI
jgi:hypothetical protein